MTNSNEEISAKDAGPITNPEEIQGIRINLKQKPRDLLLFDLITETGIGLKKLLSLKVSHLIGLKAGDRISILAGKNGKYSNIMTEVVFKSFLEYISKLKPEPDDYLFKSKKGQKPINLSSASNMIRGWLEDANIKGKTAMSLRKTWTYNQANKIIKNNSIISSGLFGPIKTPTAQEIIYNKLSEAIISCKIPPGSRLTTSEISKAFNVSHAPARVALNWLEAKGFIISKKKKASIVKELSINELKEIMQIRLILETAAIELSYGKCTKDTLDIAESIIRSNEHANTLEEHDRLNTLFHQTLYRDADMPMLMQLISDLCNRVSPYVILYHSKKDPNNALYDLYHKEMIEGMRRKDPETVRKNLILDLNKSTATIGKILDMRAKTYTKNPPISFTI